MGPAALAGAATGDVVGAATGDVVGAVTGDVVGAATGDVVGAATGDVVGAVTGDVVGAATGDVVGALELEPSPDLTAAEANAGEAVAGAARLLATVAGPGTAIGRCSRAISSKAIAAYSAAPLQSGS